MKKDIHNEILELAPFAYAYHEIVFDKKNKIIDFIFLETNKVFETIFRIKKKDVLNKKVFENNLKIEEKLEKIYNDISIIEKEKVFEECFENLNRWFEIKLIVTQNQYLTIFFIDITEKKRKIEEFENFFNVNLDLLCIADLDGNFVKVNKEWERVLGYKTEDLEKKKFLDFIHTDDIKSTLKQMEKLDKNATVFNFVNRYRTKNGEYRYIEWRSHPADNKLIYAAARDITENRENEKKIIESQKNAELFFEQSLVGFFIMMLDEPIKWNDEIDKDKVLDYVFSHQKVTKVNKEMLKQYKAKKEDFLGLTPNDFFSHDLKQGKEVWKKFFDEKKLHIDTKEKDFEGNDIYIEGDYITLFDEQNRITGHFGVQWDITHKKKIEQEIIEEKRRLNDIIIGTNSGTWEWNVQTGEVIFNEIWANMIGYSLEELEPISIKTWAKFAHPEDLKKSNELINKHFKKELDYYEFESRMKHKNGEWIWVLDRGKVSKWSEDNKPLLMSGTHQNITEKKKIEQDILKSKEEAQRANRAKSEFLANMSHEIRTPLNGVIGFTDLLMKTSLNNTQKQYAENILTSSHALLGIINDILDFSKIEANKLELDIIECDLHEIISQTVDIIKYQSGLKKLEFLLDFSLDIPNIIETDPIRLKQIFINLLSNAVKFTEKGEILFKISFNKIDENIGEFEFKIKDTGIGISKEKQEKLFKAFSQADSSTTRKFGGTGLGLVISSLLVEKMNSKIYIDSKENSGSTFYFTIKSIYKKKDILNEKLNFNRVMIIDDNEKNCQILYENFEYFNIKSDYFLDGFSALKALEEDVYDLLIVDYHMPYFDGLDFIKFVREKLKIDKEKQPIILLHSSSENQELREKLEKLDVKFSLVKPVKAKELFYFLKNINSNKNNDILLDKKSEKLEEKKVNCDCQKINILIAEDIEMNVILLEELLKEICPLSKIFYAKDGYKVIEICNKEKIDLIFMDIQMPNLDGISATKIIREKDNKVYIVALTAGAIKEEKEKALNSGMNDFLTKPIDIKLLKDIFIKNFYNVIYEKEEKNKKLIIDINSFNKEELLERIDNNMNLYYKMLTLSKKNILEKFDAFFIAIKKNDKDEIKLLSHAIKGISKNLSYNKLAKISIDIENKVDNDIEIIKKEFENLQNEFKILEKIIENELKNGN